ncbi:SseB family protein [Thiobacter aerophilum]|uniref:SseB family protein n=1 Tax=Thiobacter aerophilum TaxID=3121275 RepID=A0ABV0EF18_9BURK
MDEQDLRNDLERHLYAAQTGQTDSEVFMKQLVDAQVFMPVKDDSAPGGIQRSTRAQPLVVRDEAAGVSVLVLFTSPERAKPFLQHYPEFRGGILTEFRWVLERMEPGFGIVLNPGDELGLDLEPELVAQLLHSLRNVH